MSQLVRTVQRWLDDLGGLGASVVLVLAMVDILFPGSTGIVANVAGLLAGLNAEGQYSLAAIFLFLLVHHCWRSTRSRWSEQG